MTPATLSKLYICLIIITFLPTGCAQQAEVIDPNAGVTDDPTSPEQVAVDNGDMDDFVSEVATLQGTFGDENKTDFMSMATVCEIVRPIARFGDDLTRSGFLMGIEGTRVLGFFNSFGGYDLVWDLYHQQFSVSRYGGSLTTTDELALTATAYVGYAAGFEHGVADWNGTHEQVSLEFGLPWLDDFLSIEVTGFKTDTGVFGYTAGITAGLDAFPEPLPIEVTISEGIWEPHKLLIAEYYRRFLDAKFLGFKLPLKAHLIDPLDGSVCDPDWPMIDEDRDCVIQFGDPDQSRTRRSIHLARSLCIATHGCALPMTWPVASSAIAIGKLRDLGLTPSELCPNI